MINSHYVAFDKLVTNYQRLDLASLKVMFTIFT